MAWPVVIALSGKGTPVTESLSAFATPAQVASNGYGAPVAVVTTGGAPVTIGAPTGYAWLYDFDGNHLADFEGNWLYGPI